MTVYVRRESCGLCDQQVFWNSESHVLTCGCGQYPFRHVDLSEYVKVRDACVPWKGATVRRMFPEAFRFVKGKEVLREAKR